MDSIMRELKLGPPKYVRHYDELGNVIEKDTDIYSVTSVLSMIQNPAYIDVPEDVIQKAYSRGSWLHAVAEKYYRRGVPVPISRDMVESLSLSITSMCDHEFGYTQVDDKVMQYIHGFDTFLATYGKHIDPFNAQVEVPIVVPDWHLGTRIDLIANWDNAWTIVDWKTSSSAKLNTVFAIKYKLQLAAMIKMFNNNLPKLQQCNVGRNVVFTTGRKSGLGEMEQISGLDIEIYWQVFQELFKIFLNFVQSGKDIGPA